MLNNDDRSIKISKANFEIRNKTRKKQLKNWHIFL